jgi:hypothetical protein
MEEVVTAPPVTTKALTEDLIAPRISTLGKSANGAGLVFVKLEVNGVQLDNVSLLSNYPHLRYLVGDVVCAASRHVYLPHIHPLPTQDLSDNVIPTLSPGLAGMTHLLSLDVHGNALTAFPGDEITGKRYLQHVNLAKNAIIGEVGKGVVLNMATWMSLNGGWRM